MSQQVTFLLALVSAVADERLGTTYQLLGIAGTCDDGVQVYADTVEGVLTTVSCSDLIPPPCLVQRQW